MSVGWNIETLLTVGALAGSILGALLILRANWKQYGLLFVITGIVGLSLCFLFLYYKLYTFPYQLIPGISIPFTLILTVFPFAVLFGVRYSPSAWGWKIPFYWTLVHFGVLAEYIIEKNTQIIKYSPNWGIWDSYVTWWLFFLVMEWVGGKVVKSEYRKPLDPAHLRYGSLGWCVVHFLLIVTFLIAGTLLAKLI